MRPKQPHANGKMIHQGDWITLDGNEGVVYLGQVKLSTPELPKRFSTLMGWADSIRNCTCAPMPIRRTTRRRRAKWAPRESDSVRTEHMFFKDFEHPEKSIERQLAIQEMIIADSSLARKKALDKLLPYQRRDFIGIFKVMDGFPVTIRLIDPPLHEFVPHDPEKQKELAAKIGSRLSK